MPRSRSARTASGLLALVAALALSACGVGAAPSPTATAHRATASPHATPTTTASAPSVPDGVLARVTTTVRQQSGARLAVTLTVRTPVDWNSTDGAPIAARIAQTCAGELDSSVFAQQDYRFVRIDMEATAVSGDWQGGAVAVWPEPTDQTGIVAAGSATQLALTAAPSDGEMAETVPHCAQPAVITGAGTGEVDIAVADAAPPVWASLQYGLSVAPTTDGSEPLPLLFADCVAVGAPGQGVDWLTQSHAPTGDAGCLLQAT